MNSKSELDVLREIDSSRYDVSIIVPTYNREEYLEECLDSLLNQTLPPLEIIVIDDGSADNTSSIVRSYGDKLRYLWKENEGKPKAVNLGLSIALGNIIWIFDDDDVALPDAIKSRIDVFKENPEAGFVYSPHYLGYNAKNGKIKKNFLQKVQNYNSTIFFSKILQDCFFHLGSALVRKTAYEEVGEFDPKLLSSEDYDMQIRLARKYQAVYCKYPSFIFRQHSGVRGAQSVRYSISDRTKVFRLYDQSIGKKIRSELFLGEFLTPKKNNIDTNIIRRTALLQRMLIMASKGCILEMFEDLKKAHETLNPNEFFTTDELQLVATSITTGYAYDAILADLPKFYLFIESIPSSPAGKQAKRALAKGFFILAKSYPGSILERIKKIYLALIIFSR